MVRAMKARGKREKDMCQMVFARGFQLGADMFKTRILHATAGYIYEEELNAREPEICPVVCSDPMSDGPLAVVDDSAERYNQDTGHFEPASY